MRMLRAVMLAVGVLAVADPALAVIVQGSPTCSQWMKDRQDQPPGWSALANESWLIGYLSGLAVGAKTEFWDRGTDKPDPDGVYKWMDEYCRANPLKYLDEGAARLFIEHTRN